MTIRNDKGEPNASSAPSMTQHGPSSSSGRNSASPLNQQVALAMDLADVIRKHNASTANEEKKDGFLRNFLMTPGVQQGFFTLCVCTAVAVPTRRFVLSVSKRQLNLGTVFPDLMISPALAMLTAQCALFTGSCCGCAAYLDRLANISPTAPSPIADAVCSDRKFTHAAMNSNQHAPPLLLLDEHNNSWDPRVSAVESLRRALQSCRERRALQQQEQHQQQVQEGKSNNNNNNEEKENAPKEEMSSTTRISWWKQS